MTEQMTLTSTGEDAPDAVVEPRVEPDASPVEPFIVTEPGVYLELDERVYHDDPVPEDLGRSLSQSGAKLLLPPSTPSHFKWARDHGGYESTAAQDLGSAVHTRVLGRGAKVIRTEYDAWRTKEAKQAKALIEAEGNIALRAQDEDLVGDMAEAVLAHPLGRILFEQEGSAEASLFWQDERTEVWRRSRLDFLPTRANSSGLMLVPDLKTAASAHKDKFRRQCEDFSYYLQSPWYADMVVALGLAEAASVLYVVVEKKPPHPVMVAELDAPALAQGREEIARALDLYAECQGTDHWPGYPQTDDQVVRISLSHWFYRDRTEELPS